LSSLEARLIHSNFHLNIHLDVDEMETFFSVMKNNIKTEQNYVPYNENKFGLNFYNYGLSLFPLSKSNT
jgi:UV DNA damage repair endonuclease